MFSRKRVVIVVLSLCFGYATGWLAFHVASFAPLVYSAKKAGITQEQIEITERLVQQTMKEMVEDEHDTALMSIAALDFLSEGKTDEVKKILASKVVEFYVQYGPASQPEGEEIAQDQKKRVLFYRRVKFLENIEEATETSSALKQAIKEATQKP